MASNLKVDIVKPTATNGSLSLKGDSGGSATTNGISVDSSGDTSITGTTTISTADINGGTIDGTTIGASSAAAGTFSSVTATTADINGGTIDGATLGSTVVFPAGHVIQTTQNTYNSGDSAGTTSATTSKVSDGSSNYYWSHTISGMTAGNDVLVNFSFIGFVTRSSESAGGAWHIYRDNTIIYESNRDFTQYSLAGGATNIEIFSYINLSFLDTGATSTSHTYYLGYSSYISSTVQVRSGSDYPPFVAILQEIQS